MSDISIEVMEFINRRFPDDCDWTTGNCYWFAVILQHRFPQGKIYYDVIAGHFLVRIGDTYYDHNGGSRRESRGLIAWDVFDKYDAALKQRIIRDCVL